MAMKGAYNNDITRQETNMPRFEQIHVSRSKRRSEYDSDQPADLPRIVVSGGGTGPDVDELLERIETVLAETTESTLRALGRQASTDPA